MAQDSPRQGMWFWVSDEVINLFACFRQCVYNSKYVFLAYGHEKLYRIFIPLNYNSFSVSAQNFLPFSSVYMFT